MDSIKTNLDVLQEGVSAAEQIKKVYDQYNEIVLCDKALIYQNVCGEFRDLQKKTNNLQQDIERHKEEETQESEHLETLQREEEVLQEEWNSLADSDAAKLKDTEEKLRMQQKTADENSRQKKQQEEEKNQKLRETELMIRESEERSDGYWRQVEKAVSDTCPDLERLLHYFRTGKREASGRIQLQRALQQGNGGPGSQSPGCRSGREDPASARESAA